MLMEQFYERERQFGGTGSLFIAVYQLMASAEATARAEEKTHIYCVHVPGLTHMSV